MLGEEEKETLRLMFSFYRETLGPAFMDVIDNKELITQRFHDILNLENKLMPKEKND